MTAYSPADLQAVKVAADVYNLASTRTKLRKIAAQEYAGPCPVCGGRDRFHVNTKFQRWMCSHCTGRETWQDVIALRRFLTGETFSAAVEALGGRRDATLPPAVSWPLAPTNPPKWKDEKWQTSVHTRMIEAAKRLDGKQGAAGRAYLEQRGIAMHTAHLWLLGYAPVSPPWDQAARRRTGGPSITMPYLRHDNEQIMAVRYRRIGAEEDRYINEPGSTVRLFGLHLMDLKAPALVIVEGELNAISIWQASRDLRLCVVSIGGQSVKQETLGDIGRLSSQFKRCVVWCDEPEKSQQLRAVVTSPSVQMRRSPLHDGHKLDANHLLQRGLLNPFLHRMMAR